MTGGYCTSGSRLEPQMLLLLVKGWGKGKGRAQDDLNESPWVGQVAETAVTLAHSSGKEHGKTMQQQGRYCSSTSGS